jgi:hypothetical protein
MTQVHDGLGRYEEQLTRLLSQVGTVDPASAGFRALFGECARCAAGLEGELQRLAQAPVGERNRARAQLRRLVGLNALVQDAVRRERDGVAELMAQARLVRASLAQTVQAGLTGDSCDVRG